MSGLILCTKKSDSPYKIKESDMNIYSIEELAYYLYNNAYFVDEDFFSDELTDYIEEELKLGKIAKRLKLAKTQRLGFVDKMMIVIIGSGYFTEQETKEFENQLKEISTKSMHERMNARAKMLFDKGKFISAKKIYEQILTEKRETSLPDSFYANISVQIAMIKCQMFYFGDAYQYLKAAYKEDRQEETLKKMILVKLMEAKMENVTSDLAEFEKINKELVFQCKELVFNTEENIISSDEYREMKDVFRYDGSMNLDEYYHGLQDTLNIWKKEYREYIS